MKEYFYSIVLLGIRVPSRIHNDITTFINQETDFIVGGDQIAAKLKQAVLSPEIIKPKRGTMNRLLKSLKKDLHTKGKINASIPM